MKDKKSNRVTIKEAAELLDITEQTLRIALQTQRVDFGFATKGEKRWVYHISRKKLMEYVK